jgi:extradiol dioxygenase family protein
MVCPECGLDHDGGSAHCMDEEAGGAGAAIEFIPLAEVADEADFQALANRLEEEGVPWYVQSEPRIGLEPAGQVAMIYVAENSFRRARRAVEALRPVGIDQKL